MKNKVYREFTYKGAEQKFMRRMYNALETMRLFAFFNVFWFHTGYYHFIEYYESDAWGVVFSLF